LSSSNWSSPQVDFITPVPSSYIFPFVDQKISSLNPMSEGRFGDHPIAKLQDSPLHTYMRQLNQRPNSQCLCIMALKHTRLLYWTWCSLPPVHQIIA